jgi:Holliday junction DNA helicase RuvA
LIVGIEGTLIRKEPTFLHINVNGVVYEVFVSLNCSSTIKDKSIKLHTTHIIREDNQSLYGFTDINEKKLFDRVIKINGVGPKVALAICSTFTPNSFSQIVQSGDINMLKMVPGIGPKGAGRILVELSGFVIEVNEDGTTSSSPSVSEAVQALESLGFKKDVITNALKNCVGNTTSEIVKEALKRLQK